MRIFNSLLMYIKVCTFLFIVFNFSLSQIHCQQLAFPTAMGAGAYTSGGRGGIVVHVTNLNDSGAGSLRWALTDPGLITQDRTIVFDVSGLINLNSNIEFAGPSKGGNASGSITVAGQTAPLGGITITGGKIRMFGVDNVIWRYTKFRETTPTDGCLSSTDSNNVIFDHLSASNTPDICFALTSNTLITTDKTLQYCLMAQSKNAFITGDTTPQGDLDYGEISIIRNAYYNVSHRIPLKGGAGIKVDVINNIAHNWKARLIRMDDWDYTLNHIGNYYQGGTNTTNILKHCSWNNNPDGNYFIYNENNYMDPNETTLEYLNDESIVWTEYQNNFAYLPSEVFVSTPFPFKGNSNFTIFDSNDLKSEVLPQVGAYKYINDNGTVSEYRDVYDTEHVNGIDIDDASTRVTAIELPIQTLSNNRPANFYESNAHIPEVYLLARGIIGTPTIHNEIQPSGYTLLEEYINQVDDSFLGNVEATAVNVTPEVATLNVPETLNLGVQFTPVNTTDQTGVWTSEDEAVATVDSNGLVTSISEGSTIIRFESNDGGFTDTAQITVTNINIPLESITITPVSLALDIGESDQLLVDYFPSNSTNQAGIWISANPEVAIVDENGFVTGIAEGTTSISYLADDSTFGSISASSSIIVTAPLPLAAPIISSVTRTGNDYVVTFYQPSNTAIPEGGYNTYITSSDTGNIRQNQGDFDTLNGQFTRTYSGLNTSIDQTFEIDARYVQFDPNEFRMSDPVTYFADGTLEANAGNDETICEGELIQLTASEAPSYLWSTGETTQSIAVSPIITTSYTLTVSDGNSTETDEVIVFVDALPDLTVSENVTIIEGESIELNAVGANTYLWSTGETTNSITVSPIETTIYNVTGSNGLCEVSGNITVTVEPLLSVDLGEDQQICEGSGESIILDAGSGDTYLWNTGETTQTISVDPVSTSTYSVTVTSGTQQDTDSITIFVDPNPNVVILNGDSVDILNGDFVTLSATGANTYEWNNGATQPNIAVSPSQTTVYEVRGFINECYDDKQVVVNVIPEVEADAGDDVEICLGDTVLLTATGGDEYVWSNGEITQSIEVSPTETTEYTVTVFNALDFDEDSVVVNVISDCEESIEEPDPTISSDEPFEFTFDIFPNPTSNYVDVRIAGIENLARIYIYDMMGKLIYQKRVQNGSANVSSISRFDMSKLIPGIYYIQFQNLEKTMAKKLLVQ